MLPTHTRNHNHQASLSFHSHQNAHPFFFLRVSRMWRKATIALHDSLPMCFPSVAVASKFLAFIITIVAIANGLALFSFVLSTVMPNQITDDEVPPQILAIENPPQIKQEPPVIDKQIEETKPNSKEQESQTVKQPEEEPPSSQESTQDKRNESSLTTDTKSNGTDLPTSSPLSSPDAKANPQRSKARAKINNYIDEAKKLPMSAPPSNFLTANHQSPPQKAGDATAPTTLSSNNNNSEEATQKGQQVIITSYNHTFDLFDQKLPWMGSDETDRPDLKEKRNIIREAFRHAWHGYETLAFGHDELLPVTNKTNDSWGGFGVTLVDALDTMIIMRLDKEFIRAREHVANIEYAKDYGVSFFETTIRHLGGLLSAYELSRDTLFLDKAKYLADRLSFAFNTTTGIPYGIVNLATGIGRNPAWSRGSSILAEAGSVQLEFSYLSHHTNNPIYGIKADKVIELMESASRKYPGLFPVFISPTSGTFLSEAISFGGLGDSFYEYLLKRWILSGKKDTFFRNIYDKSMSDMITHLVKSVTVKNTNSSEKKTFSYVSEMKGTHVWQNMDHLVCYVPGMVALGAQGIDKQEHLDLAKALLDTCIALYKMTPSGLGPERVSFGSRLAAKSIARAPAPRLSDTTSPKTDADEQIELGKQVNTWRRGRNLEELAANVTETLIETTTEATTETITEQQPSSSEEQVSSAGNDTKSTNQTTKTTIDELVAPSPTNTAIEEASETESSKSRDDHVWHEGSIDWNQEDLWFVQALREQGVSVVSSRYLLRPETIESLFVLYRTTKDEMYRKVGWEIFLSIEKHCRTPAAYSGILDVKSAETKYDNSMQSFFFAETLKYLYLLFSPDDVLPLDQYVFNTEAHPLGIYN